MKNYKIRILYFSFKYGYNISNKHVKQVSQTDKHKDNSQTKKNLLFTPQQYYD